jgi:hypothetical protein
MVLVRRLTHFGPHAKHTNIGPGSRPRHCVGVQRPRSRRSPLERRWCELGLAHRGRDRARVPHEQRVWLPVRPGPPRRQVRRSADPGARGRLRAALARGHVAQRADDRVRADVDELRRLRTMRSFRRHVQRDGRRLVPRDDRGPLLDPGREHVAPHLRLRASRHDVRKDPRDDVCSPGDRACMLWSGRKLDMRREHARPLPGSRGRRCRRAPRRLPLRVDLHRRGDLHRLCAVGGNVRRRERTVRGRRPHGLREARWPAPRAPHRLREIWSPLPGRRQRRRSVRA